MFNGEIGIICIAAVDLHRLYSIGAIEAEVATGIAPPGRLASKVVLQQEVKCSRVKVRIEKVQVSGARVHVSYCCKVELVPEEGLLDSWELQVQRL